MHKKRVMPTDELAKRGLLSTARTSDERAI
jgi:hypothetical protein